MDQYFFLSAAVSLATAALTYTQFKPVVIWDKNLKLKDRFKWKGFKVFFLCLLIAAIPPTQYIIQKNDTIDQLEEQQKLLSKIERNTNKSAPHFGILGGRSIRMVVDSVYYHFELEFKTEKAGISDLKAEMVLIDVSDTRSQSFVVMFLAKDTIRIMGDKLTEERPFIHTISVEKNHFPNFRNLCIWLRGEYKDYDGITTYKLDDLVVYDKINDTTGFITGVRRDNIIKYVQEQENKRKR